MSLAYLSLPFLFHSVIFFKILITASFLYGILQSDSLWISWNVVLIDYLTVA